MASGTITSARKNTFDTAQINLVYANGGAYIPPVGSVTLLTIKKFSDIAENDTSAELAVDITNRPTLTEEQMDIPTGSYKYDIKVYKAGVMSKNADEGIWEITKTVTKRNG